MIVPCAGCPSNTNSRPKLARTLCIVIVRSFFVCFVGQLFWIPVIIGEDDGLCHITQPVKLVNQGHELAVHQQVLAPHGPGVRAYARKQRPWQRTYDHDGSSRSTSWPPASIWLHAASSRRITGFAIASPRIISF